MRLCLRLCNSATGTVLTLPVMNTAVPPTRWGGCASKPSTKGSSGIPSSLTRVRSNMRPEYQVISKKKAKPPNSNGNQPPSAILSKLAAKNEKSTIKKALMTSVTNTGCHFHSMRVTTPASIVVMTMVVVTATPYAAARLSDFLNASTTATTSTSNIQLIKGI